MIRKPPCLGPIKLLHSSLALQSQLYYKRNSPLWWTEGIAGNAQVPFKSPTIGNLVGNKKHADQNAAANSVREMRISKHASRGWLEERDKTALDCTVDAMCFGLSMAKFDTLVPRNFISGGRTRCCAHYILSRACFNASLPKCSNALAALSVNVHWSTSNTGTTDMWRCSSGPRSWSVFAHLVH